MFSNDELRAASLRNPHRVVMIRVVGVAVLVAGLVLCPVPGSSQTTLDDLVIRAFDIDVSMSPVPLKYDTVGGQRRYAARGTLRGTTTAMLEVTAPSPVSTARFFFDSDVKVPSVAVAGGRRHTVRDRVIGGLRMQFYVPPGDDRNLDKLADFTGRAVGFYSTLLYPFPYSELRVVSVSDLGNSIGIGYPAFLLIDDRAFRNNLPGQLNRDSSLLHLMAHEAAHSYVPSKTVPKGVGFVWLSEGFAEYLSLMAVEALLGPGAFQQELQEERDDYAAAAGTSAEPSIAAITFANYHGQAAADVIYAKGSLVLHMLRSVLGDEAFRKGLAAYFTTFRGRAARVQDFQESMEQAAGQSLDWFFSEWIQGKALPDYTVTQVKSIPTAEGTFRTTATVRNLGTGRMPVELAFVMEGDTQVQKVDMPSGGSVTVTATTPKAVRLVEVDPNKWVIQKNYKNDVTLVR